MVFFLYLSFESFKVQQALKFAHTSAHFCHAFVTLMAVFGKQRLSASRDLWMQAARA